MASTSNGNHNRDQRLTLVAAAVLAIWAVFAIAIAGDGMEACQERHSFSTCHYALLR